MSQKHHPAEPMPDLWRFAVENAADGIVWLRRDGSHSYANRAVCQLLDYSRDELMALTAFDINPCFTPENWGKHWETLKRAGVLSFESRLRRKDGRSILVEISANFLSHEGEDYNCVSIRDVTGRKRAEEEARNRSRQQAAVADLGRKALRGTGLDELRDTAVEIVAEALGVEHCQVLERLPDGSALRLVAGVGWQKGLVGRATVEAEPGLHAGYTLQTDDAVIMEDRRTEARFDASPLLLDHDVISSISVAIPGESGPWGVLGAYSSLPRTFTREDAAFLQSMANVLAEAAERTRAEEISRRSSMLLRVAGQTARLGGWAADLTAGRVLWSDEVCAIHDMPPGTTPTLEEGIRFYAPEWRDRIEEVFGACARDGTPYDEEMEIITARGRCIQVRAIGEAVRDGSGKIVQVQGAFQDITALKQVERRLLQSQQRFRELADAMPMIVWTANADGVMDFANRAMNEYTGIANADLPSDAWLEAIHPDDRDRCQAAWSGAVRRGERYSIEFRVRNRADGCYRWHLVRAVPIRDEADEIVQWYGTATDIHDRKATEEEINRLATRLQNTLESITDAFYTLDRQWRFTYVNGEAERLLRRSRTALLGKEIWEAFPELRGSRIHQEYRRAVREHYTVQFEVRSPTLHIWLEVHGYPSEEGLTVYFRDISERKRAEADIQFLALYDPLTRLPNRRLLQDRLQQALDTATRNRQRGGALFLDLDQFKTLNDTLGHDDGDRLLQEVAARLTDCLRRTDTVGRFGGDEFVVILGELGGDAETAAEHAGRIGEKILATLNQPYRLQGLERHISASMGVTLFGGNRDTVNDVLKRADFAMYQAKAEGRNGLRLFDPAMQTTVNARVELEAQMRKGLQRREFLPYYQPQVDREGRLTGAEVLARWRHPRRGLVSPAEFIPVAEDTGLILPLGRYLLETACTQLASWAMRADTAHLDMAVNISARQFHHPDFVEQVLDVLDRTGADPQRLRLEITESLLLRDMDATITRMTELKTRGVSFSLDDFGTGYSSLYYLKRLPLEQLKIDQRFVRGVLNDPVDAAIVRTVIVLARSLGLGVVAEGVEREAVRDFLARHDCFAYQGHLFSRPLAIEQFEAYRRAQISVRKRARP